MFAKFKAFARRGAVLSAATIILSFTPLVADCVGTALGVPMGHGAARAQSQAPSEAEAFEAAKALGTADAWNAFVANYPTGFRADLARAYLKQLAGGAPATPSTPLFTNAPEQAAFEQPCSEQPKSRSRESTVPVKLKFINPTDGTYVLQWIDFNGQLKEFGTLEPGAEKTVDTHVTHPWIIAYGEGSCRQLFLPLEGVSIARVKPEPELQKAKSAAPAKPIAKKPVAPPALQCAQNYRKVGNQCVLMQNCGANATRNPEGDCYCNRGFRMMNGQCTIPKQQPNQCRGNEVYSSSMGQCIPR